MIQSNFAILECKKCHYQSADGIVSMRWLKDKIVDKMVICTQCEQRKIIIVDSFMLAEPYKLGSNQIYELWRGKALNGLVKRSS